MTTIQRYWKKIAVIAVNAHKETIRSKILFSLVAFALVVIAGSLLAASVSLGQDLRVIDSFSLTAMLLFLLVITLFSAGQIVAREVEQKTIYMTLTKPVNRDQFYLGKYLGICLTTAICAAVMGAIIMVVVHSNGQAITWSLLLAMLFILLEVWLVAAVGLLFSTFATPLASIVYTIALTLIGHSSSTIWEIASKNTGFLKYSLESVYYIFPNLEKFNLRSLVLYNVQPAASQVGTTLLYFLAYTGLLVVLGLLAFRNDEF